jgi:hypothetical protein
LLGIAAALAATEVASDAATLLGAADAAAQATAVEFEPLEAELHARLTRELGEELGARRFASVHEGGGALSLDDAVEHALRASQPTVSRSPGG